VPDKGVLVDTGPLAAIFDARDQFHALCVEAAKKLASPVYTCWPVVTEAVYLLKSHASIIEVRQLLSRVASEEIEVLPIQSGDVPKVLDILDKYADQDFDFADACLMYLAERSGVSRIFTLDRRDFGVFRLASGASLTLIPDDA
jgi:predicted nucleic acid-binding protein